MNLTVSDFVILSTIREIQFFNNFNDWYLAYSNTFQIFKIYFLILFKENMVYNLQALSYTIYVLDNT